MKWTELMSTKNNDLSQNEELYMIFFMVCTQMGIHHRQNTEST